MPASSPPRPAYKPRGELTLQELCVRVVCRNISATNVLELLKVTKDVDLPSGSDVHAMCMRYVVQAYAVLHERRSGEEIRQAIPEELYLHLEQAVQEREQLSASLKAALGRLVERPEPQGSGQVDTPSVAGHLCSYTHDTLKAGVKWPDGVDPAHREQYMCSTDFELLLGMPYDRFCALPEWARTNLKKGCSLF